MSVATNAARLAAALAAVKAHPMCANLSDDGTRYLVTYPLGYFPDGARASQGMGKALALERLLVVMERHWRESFP